MTYTFTLPYEIPSLNKWSKWHWAKQAKERKKYEGEFLFQRQNYRYESRHFQKSNETIYNENLFPLKNVNIHIISYRFQLITDADNRILKGVLDALVNQGIIEDDNEKVIGIPTFEQHVDRKNRRTVIEIK